VAVAGERPGAVGDAGDDLERHDVPVATLSHAGCGLGDGTDKRPRQPAQVPAAGARVARGGNRKHAIGLGADLNDPQPVHGGAAQVGHQMNLRVFGHPARAAGQRR
jgi:hypothetical protein